MILHSKVVQGDHVLQIASTERVSLKVRRKHMGGSSLVSVTNEDVMSFDGILKGIFHRSFLLNGRIAGLCFAFKPKFGWFPSDF